MTLSAAPGIYRISLSGKNGFGKSAIIDLEDSDKVKDYSWYLSNSGYPMTGKYIPKTQKTEQLFLHKIIANIPKGKVGDHINGNKLDARKCNIRICTQGENTRNQKLHKDKLCLYRGVTFIKEKWRLKKWRASIVFHRKCIFLGYFYTQEEAAIVYNSASEKYFGEFGRLNQT